MEIKKYSIFTLLIIFPSLVSATGYNYLPNDVYIKQQEEKAALEYRISTLETSLQNSPTLSILNIESRISQLKQEKQTEINYITGLYGKNGISNQLPAAVAKIDAKYDGQISNLEQQINEYEDAVSEADDLKNEIKSLKSQLSKIEQQVSQQSPSSDNTTSVTVPSAVDMFEYIDALPNNEAREIMGILGVENNKLYEEVMYLVKLKYPYGKPGSALYKWHSENSNIPQVISVEPTETYVSEPYIPKPVIKKVDAVQNEEVATSDEFQIPTTTTEIYVAPQEPVPEVKAEPVVEQPKTIWQSVVSFFKKLWF